MKDLSVEIKARVDTAWDQADTRFDAAVHAAFVARYQAIVAAGYAANPPPDAGPKTRGRSKQGKARPATFSIGCAVTSRRSWPS